MLSEKIVITKPYVGFLGCINQLWQNYNMFISSKNCERKSEIVGECLYCLGFLRNDPR